MKNKTKLVRNVYIYLRCGVKILGNDSNAFVQVKIHLYYPYYKLNGALLNNVVGNSKNIFCCAYTVVDLFARICYKQKKTIKAVFKENIKTESQ